MGRNAGKGYPKGFATGFKWRQFRATQTQTVQVNPNDTQTLTFYNTPSTTLVIEKYIEGTTTPLEGVTFLVTDSSGAVVGPSNGEYITDENGRIVIDDLEPGTTITAREVKTLEGYVLDTAPKSIEIKSGEVQTLRFYNSKQGTLVIRKLDSVTKEPLAGVEFELTYADGGYVDDAIQRPIRPKFSFSKRTSVMRLWCSTTGSSILPVCSSHKRICDTSLSYPISTCRRNWCCRTSRVYLPRWTTTVRRYPMCAFTQRARAAEMAQSDFGRALSGAERRMERAAMELARTRRLLEREDMAGAFGSAFAFSAEVEKLALLARVLPAYTGHPKAAELTEQMLLDTVPIEMGYAKRGWFLLKIPALLPKKGTGSPIYIQQYLYPALRRYFDGKPPALYRSCVLAYRHVYQHDRPERAYRDHDNIEVNMVTDIVTLYLMPDDAPRRCAHYYCSAAGEVDCTEVYVVPASRFPEWLAAAQADDLKEEMLYETSEIWD